jgi:hypothetical protein
MVMAQIPALFLPKKEPEVKPQVKKRTFKKKEKSNETVSALFKGRFDGYQKNDSEVCSAGAT